MTDDTDTPMSCHVSCDVSCDIVEMTDDADKPMSLSEISDTVNINSVSSFSCMHSSYIPGSCSLSDKPSSISQKSANSNVRTLTCIDDHQMSDEDDNCGTRMYDRSYSMETDNQARGVVSQKFKNIRDRNKTKNIKDRQRKDNSMLNEQGKDNCVLNEQEKDNSVLNEQGKDNSVLNEQGKDNCVNSVLTCDEIEVSVKDVTHSDHRYASVITNNSVTCQQNKFAKSMSSKLGSKLGDQTCNYERKDYFGKFSSQRFYETCKKASTISELVNNSAYVLCGNKVDENEGFSVVDVPMVYDDNLSLKENNVGSVISLQIPLNANIDCVHKQTLDLMSLESSSCKVSRTSANDLDLEQL